MVLRARRVALDGAVSVQVVLADRLVVVNSL